MKLQVYRFECAQCGNLFNAPKTVVGSYGEFILRSSGTGELAYLNALEDSTYDEVDSILKGNRKVASKKLHVVADILRKIYGEVACDTDDIGGIFGIGNNPKCPACGSHSMSRWEEILPPVFVDLNVSPVKHADWLSLSAEEKKIRVDQLLSRLGY
jgi:hypothetical protein